MNSITKETGLIADVIRSNEEKQVDGTYQYFVYIHGAITGLKPFYLRCMNQMSAGILMDVVNRTLCINPIQGE